MTLTGPGRSLGVAGGIGVDMKIKYIAIRICDACLKGEGQECHTPGCALFLHKVDLPIDENLYLVLDERDDSEDSI